MANWYLFAKAMHVVGFVSWFAGLFYVVRLFIYHVEALAKPEPDRSILAAQLTLMERRLWLVITVPAMFVTLAFGTYIAVVLARGAGGLGQMPWLHVKLTLVAMIVVYHHICGAIRRQLARGETRWTSARLRLWNELATLLLVATVMIAVFKSLFSAVWGTLGLIALGIVLAVAVKLVRRRAGQA